MALPVSQDDDTTFRAGWFQLDRGYRVRRPGGRRDWLLVETVAGKGRIAGQGAGITVDADSVVLIPPGVPQDYGLIEDGIRWSFRWAHFHPRGDWLSLLDWPVTGNGLRRLILPEGSGRRRVRSALARMVEHFDGTASRRRLFAFNALEEALLWLDLHNEGTPGRRIDERIDRVLTHISRHLAEPLTVEGLCRVAGLSRSRFSELFREETSHSVQAWTEEQRLRRACDLLETTMMPIGSVARSSGFADPFYFSRRFRKQTGYTPRDWRAGRG